MVDKYTIGRLFKDGQTKLVIPNLEIAVTNAITSIVSSYVSDPVQTTKNFFGINVNPRIPSNKEIASVVSGILDILIIGLGVTKIEATQDYVMPFSKGIGSTGEVIHLLGARNEMINLEFKTDKYPGRLGYLIKRILQKTLEMAAVVYLIDDLFLATPCLIKKSKIFKDGSYRGAVMGELELVSLATGASFVGNILGTSRNLKSLVTKLGSGSKIGLGSSLKATASVGALAISGALVAGIVGK